MRNFLLTIVSLIAIAASAVFIRTAVLRLIPCKEPITYKIGTVDPGFGISRDDFVKDIGRARSIWETAAGKDLFEYDPHGRVTINLIYDDRQKITQAESKLTTDINQTSKVADSVKQEYSSLKQKYTDLKQAYDAALSKYNSDVAAYNSNISYWNSHGGAPKKEYQTLTQEKSDLSAEQATLESQRQELNQTAADINALIDKYNLLVEHINTNVNAINNDGLSGTQFEEGIYISDNQGERINIYQFDSQTTFVRVLAHELGHALGLDHNGNPDSIMNPINTSSSLKLTADDLQELKAACNIK